MLYIHSIYNTIYNICTIYIYNIVLYIRTRIKHQCVCVSSTPGKNEICPCQCDITTLLHKPT